MTIEDVLIVSLYLIGGLAYARQVYLYYEQKRIIRYQKLRIAQLEQVLDDRK